jgi:hypothetical protein
MQWQHDSGVVWCFFCGGGGKGRQWSRSRSRWCVETPFFIPVPPPTSHWAGKILGAWVVCLPIVAVYAFTVYAIGLTLPLLTPAPLGVTSLVLVPTPLLLVCPLASLSTSGFWGSLGYG